MRKISWLAMALAVTAPAPLSWAGDEAVITFKEGVGRGQVNAYIAEQEKSGVLDAKAGGPADQTRPFALDRMFAARLGDGVSPDQAREKLGRSPIVERVDVMPVSLPPGGEPLGLSRRRIQGASPEARGEQGRLAQALGDGASEGVNYDGSLLLRTAAFEGGQGPVLVAVNPPGITPPGTEAQQPKPSRIHPPDIPDNDSGKPRVHPPGIPGKEPPTGDEHPPHGRVPIPDRPAPVFPARIPPPPPNWWNTHESDVTIWDSLPDDWGAHHWDGETWWISPWHPWPNDFVSWDRVNTPKGFTRTQANQREDWTADLESRRVATVRRCYYRARYRYEYVEGGFNGDHWQERFDHWDAACVKSVRDDGWPDRRHLAIRFDMQGKEFLPWETEGWEFEFDGSRVRFSKSHPSYEYSIVHDDGFNIVFRAGSKILTSPDPNGVSLRFDTRGGFKLIVTDRWAEQYKGEALHIQVAVKKVNCSWYNPFCSDTRVFEATEQSPYEVRIPASAQGAYETAIPLPDMGPGKYYFKTWYFRRWDSKISNKDWTGRDGASLSK